MFTKIFYLIGIFLFLVSCQDSGRSVQEEIPEPPVFANITGTVTNNARGKERGVHIEDFSSRGYNMKHITGIGGPITDKKILVSCEGKSTLTDENGFYSLENVPVPEDRKLVVSFEHLENLFAFFQRNIVVEQNGTYSISAILTPVDIKQAIPEDGKIITEKGTIEFPPEIAGKIATICFGDPTKDEGATFPGSYEATDQDRSDVYLVSTGFLQMQVEGIENDTRNRLSPTIFKYRLPDDYQNGSIWNPETYQKYKTGDTVAWWIYNSQKGKWEQSDAFPDDPTKYKAEIFEEGGILYARAAVQGFWTVPQYFNYDSPFPFTETGYVSVKVTNQNGIPIANVYLEATGTTDPYIIRSDVTDDNGYTKIPVIASINDELNRRRFRLSLKKGPISTIYDVKDPKEGNPDTDEIYAPQKMEPIHSLLGNMVLNSNGKILGKVYDQAGNPVSNVPVYTDTGVSTYTKSDGSYSLDGLLPGTTVVSVSGQSQKVVLSPESPTANDVNFNNYNRPPETALIQPPDNSFFEKFKEVYMQAMALDKDGDVKKVDFYSGNTLLSSKNAPPYEYSWQNPPPGEHSLYVITEDDKGAVTKSPYKRIRVNNNKPDISINKPLPGASYYQPANVQVETTASDSDGMVNAVFFYYNNIYAGSKTSVPYNYTITNLPAGNYNIRTVARDDNGYTYECIVPIVVKNNPPTVVITEPENGDSFTAPATINITANANDVDRKVVKVDFYEGNNLLGTSTTAPYSMSWANVPQGNYALKAIATDDFGDTGVSPVVNITVENAPPTVEITNPKEGDSFVGLTPITIEATANDPGRMVVKVDFYADSTLLGTSNAAPYSYTWHDATKGDYALKAIATDDQGATGESPVVNITVTNAPPEVRITSPLEGATFPSPATIEILATATDPGRDVARVDFYEGNNLLGSDSSIPYSYTWNNVPDGAYALKVIAYDDEGANTVSTIVNVFVNQLPNMTVTPGTGLDSIGQPGGPFTPGNKVYTISANSNIPWTVSSDKNWVTLTPSSGTATAAQPSTVTASINSNANALTAGTYNATLTFTNTLNGSGNTTRQVGLIVNPAPAVQITSPANGTSYNAPATVEIIASATDTKRAITKVDFYEGNNLLGTDTTSPYSYIWNNVPQGNYALKTIATDNYGFTTTSAIVNINVILLGIMTVTPQTSFESSGFSGGPFTPANTVYTISASQNNVPWSVTSDKSWLTITPESGTATLAQASQVTISINSSANSLPEGLHTATITFTNTTGGLGNTTRTANLNIGELNKMPSNSWRHNGTAFSLCMKDNILYSGGNFSNITRYTGTAAILHPVTGIPILIPQIDSASFAVCPDGNGGFYVGGSFEYIGTTPRKNLAHILSNGSVDPLWNPSPGGLVRCLFLQGNILYVGGDFNTIGGQTRKGLAALDTTTGNATAWHPHPSEEGFSVYTIEVQGNLVYIGGAFTKVGAYNRRYLAAIDTATGIPTAWNPDCDGPVYTIALGARGVVYAGGNFWNVGGQSRSYLAAIDATTGGLTAWNTNSTGSVKTLLLNGNTLYAGGQFTTIGGQPRYYLAALDTTTGNATNWNPNPNGNVDCLSLYGNSLYAGGYFTSIGGKYWNYLAEVDIITGLATDWNPNVKGAIRSVKAEANKIYIGGDFRSIGESLRDRLAAIDLISKDIMPWNPGANDDVRSMVINQDTLYVGGNFSTIAGQSRKRIASFDLTTGNLTNWNPTLTGSISEVTCMLGQENTLYVGGNFTDMGGQARNNIASFDMTTGNITNWNPNLNGQVYAMTRSGNILYIGGTFTRIGDQDQSYLAALELSTGILLPWKPTLNNRVNAILVQGNTVYVGGTFTTVGGQERKYLAAIDATTGNPTAWNPAANARINAIKGTDQRVYVGGFFSNIAGESRMGIASFSSATGSLTSWRPNIYTIQAIYTSANSLYAAGQEYIYEFLGPVRIALDSFEAIQAREDAVLLQWKTKSELEGKGFHVWRRESKEVQYTRLTKEPLPACGSQESEAEYSWYDESFDQSKEYRYTLEYVEQSGNSSFYGSAAVR